MWKKEEGKKNKKSPDFYKKSKKEERNEKNIILYANGKIWVGDNKNIDKK